MTGGLAAADVELRSSESLVLSHFVAPSTLKQRLMAVDAMVVAVGITLAFAGQSLLRSDELGLQRPHLILACLTFPVWSVSFSLNRLYLARAVEQPIEEFRRIVRACLISVGVMVAVAFAFQYTELSRLWAGSVLVFVPLLLTVERMMARRIFVRIRREGQISRPILIVGTDADAIGLLHTAQSTPDLGYRVVGFVGPDEVGVRGINVLGGIESTETVLERTGATGVVISLSSVASDIVNKLTRQLTDAGYHVALSSGSATSTSPAFGPRTWVGGLSSTSSRSSAVDGAPSPSGSSTSPSPLRRWWSRHR